MTTYLLPYTAGTVTTNGTTTVTGALTAWLANVKPGDRFRIGTSSGIVASVESNTSLTLEEAWSGSASGQSYAIDRWSRGWFSGGDLALALALYNTNRPTFIPTTGQPSDAVGADGNVAFDASANIFYVKNGGSWDGGTDIVGPAGSDGADGEITRSGAQTGGIAKFSSDTQIAQATSGEIRAAINGAMAPTRQIFTTSGTWNRPSGCVAVRITCIGGGGGGGGAPSASGGQCAVGSGGSGGGVSYKHVSVTAIPSLTVTVGAGGAGGVGGLGAAGGNSVVAGHVSATGGGAGSFIPTGTSVTFVASSLPGAGASGDINFNGEAGSVATRYSGTSALSGHGGGSPLGGGGSARSSTGGGVSASGYGSGGGGALTFTATAQTGGDGSPGVVIFDEFY